MQAKEEEGMVFSKLKTKDIILAALNEGKAKKMKVNYKRSIGISWNMITKERHAKQQAVNRNEEMMQRYLEKMKLSSFLNTYENKMYSLGFINKLIKKYKEKESLVDYPHLRVKVVFGHQVWKVLTRADKNLKLYPKYYTTLTKSFDPAFKDFAHIVDLDVKRTKIAADSQAVFRKLTNILLAYAK